MKINVTFIACDGKEFGTEAECIKYESSINKHTIMPTLKMVKKICNEQRDCYSCVFNNTSGECIFKGESPTDWSLI